MQLLWEKVPLGDDLNGVDGVIFLLTSSEYRTLKATLETHDFTENPAIVALITNSSNIKEGMLKLILDH